MRKLFAEEIEIWATALPIVMVLPLVILVGPAAGLIATAGTWMILRAVAVIYATTPEKRFDPAQLRADVLLHSIEPTAPATTLAEALSQAAEERSGAAVAMPVLAEPAADLRQAS